jgi:conjugative transfer signal peptidase TraF
MTAASYFGVLINLTPSMKRGIYFRSSGGIHRGDIIAFCLKDPYKTFGLVHGYIQSGKQCHGAQPLIKQVIAVPGDDVVLTALFLTVNKERYAYPTLNKNSRGEAILIYPRGNYKRTQGYWLIGTAATNSWDSRYWGYITETQILYKLKPLLTW